VGYVVPEDAAIEQVLVQPEPGVLLIVADMGSERPAVGEPVVVTGEDEARVTVTVKEVADPYKGFRKDRPPVDGARFVMVTATFENGGDAPFRLERTGLIARDARGNLWGPASVEPAKKTKVPELQSVELGPGNRVTGRIGFQVPSDVALDGVYYQGAGHLALLAGLSDAATGPVEGDGTPSCEEIGPWWTEVGPLLERLVALPPFEADRAAMDEAASEQLLEDLGTIKSDHLAIEAPPSLLNVHRQILGALALFEQSARDQLTAQREADLELLRASGEEFEAARIVLQAALATLDGYGFDDCVDG
jgi:hypothetical protein